MRFSFEEFDFASLTAAERLLLAQELLDSVFDEVYPSKAGRQDGALSFTPQQMAELDRRVADIDSGRVVPEPWETVRERLQHR
jgi:putative addiction module component (TIGR02574 family)